MSESLRYVTNIHGLTGEESINIRELKDCAVIEFGGINIFADDLVAIAKFSMKLADVVDDRLTVAMEQAS